VIDRAGNQTHIRQRDVSSSNRIQFLESQVIIRQHNPFSVGHLKSPVKIDQTGSTDDRHWMLTPVGIGILGGKQQGHQFSGVIGMKMAQTYMGQIKNRNVTGQQPSHGAGAQIQNDGGSIGLNQDGTGTAVESRDAGT